MIRVVRVSKEDWVQYSENAHKIVFAEIKPASMDRIDFALTMEGEDSKLCGYITCRELDAKSLYWQYGGTFPGTRKTLFSFETYKSALKWTSERYDRVSVVVENKNYPMLKMLLKEDFLIVGFRVYLGQGLVELTREFKSEGGESRGVSKV